MADLKNWMLEEEAFEAEKLKHYEGAFCQGNGYFSVRASFEEGINGVYQGERYDRKFKSVTTEVQQHVKSKWGTFVPIIMGQNPYLNQVIVNLPYFMGMTFLLNGEALDMELSDIYQYTRQLNLKNGVLTRSFEWLAKDKQCKLRFHFERFASMDQKHLFVQQVKIEVLEGEGRLCIKSGIDADVTTNGYNHFEAISSKILEKSIALECQTDLGHRVMELVQLKSDDIQFKSYQSDTEIYYHSALSVKKGQQYIFEKKSIILTDRDLEPGNLDARAAAYMEAADLAYQSLYEKHCQIMASKWALADVKIKGNDKHQKAMRYSIYHLLRAINEQDYRQAICAKGFAGEAYYGRYFWDTEIFLLPFYIYTNPEAARQLLLYRYHTLEGAKKNARRYNCHGARYPWQSAVEGDEQCALWEYADNEVHITADIAYGLWHYFLATGDESFLFEYGAEILIETARFWCDRVDKNKDGSYDLINVMGPDEYSVSTLNNAFTNRMVKFNLQKAKECLALLAEKDPRKYAAFVEKMSISNEELSLFEDISEHLPVPFQKEQGYILQSEDFEQYADIDIQQIWKDKEKPFGFFVSQEKLYRSKCLKQADALALIMLFKSEFEQEIVQNTYAYYEPITTHDSSLSPVNHAIVASWIGNQPHLDKFVDYALALDYDSEKKGAEEGIHIANCGCLWQLVMMGIAQIDTAMQKPLPVASQPLLPSSWEQIEFHMVWKNQHYRVNTRREGTTIEKVEA